MKKCRFLKTEQVGVIIVLICFLFSTGRIIRRLFDPAYISPTGSYCMICGMPATRSYAYTDMSSLTYCSKHADRAPDYITKRKGDSPTFGGDSPGFVFWINLVIFAGWTYLVCKRWRGWILYPYAVFLLVWPEIWLRMGFKMLSCMSGLVLFWIFISWLHAPPGKTWSD